jgi:hypothetical protein
MYEDRRLGRLVTCRFFALTAEIPSISIANSAPRWWYVDKTKMFLEEATPGWDIVNLYKQGEIDPGSYNALYLPKLNRNKDIILAKLEKFCLSIPQEYVSIAICCWEPEGEFCHRHTFFNWLLSNENFDNTKSDC